MLQKGWKITGKKGKEGMLQIKRGQVTGKKKAGTLEDHKLFSKITKTKQSIHDNCAQYGKMCLNTKSYLIQTIITLQFGEVDPILGKCTHRFVIFNYSKY